MKKKIYVKPSISVYEIETEAILAASNPKVQAGIEDDEGGIEYGGETDKNTVYTPW